MEAEVADINSIRTVWTKGKYVFFHPTAPISVNIIPWRWNATDQVYEAEVSVSWALTSVRKEVRPVVSFSVHMPNEIAAPASGAIGSFWSIVKDWIKGVPEISHSDSKFEQGPKIGKIEQTLSDIAFSIETDILPGGQNLRIDMPVISARITKNLPVVIAASMIIVQPGIYRPKLEIPEVDLVESSWVFMEPGAMDNKSLE